MIEITDDLDALLGCLPRHIAEPIRSHPQCHNLLEVVLDLGRPPEARYPDQEVILNEAEVTQADIDHVASCTGTFGGDNRAGIERTLHRISAIRNRQGRIVGLTCRVGRAVFGTISIIQDLVQSGKSILLLGRPGVGKTTMLREVGRVLADDLKKRVVIVDTSNEIAGDGDIPHPAIGHARRMQVPTPALQHAVMIEAVENHMPEVIIIDEIGTELEAAAARTIAERGVQLIGTAHGNTLKNLILNPTLSDLVGGIQTVTLGDEEARRRGTQKSILERKVPPTFEVVVEIQGWDRVAVHRDVASVVDSLLRGQAPSPQERRLDAHGRMKKAPAKARASQPISAPASHPTRLFSFGMSRPRLEQAIKEINLPLSVVSSLAAADTVVTVKSYYRRRPQTIRDAEAAQLPIHVLKNHSLAQIQSWLASLFPLEPASPVTQALAETETAIAQLQAGKGPVELSPQSASIRRLQHQLAQRHQIPSRSQGRDPRRRVTLFPF